MLGSGNSDGRNIAAEAAAGSTAQGGLDSLCQVG